MEWKQALWDRFYTAAPRDPGTFVRALRYRSMEHSDRRTGQTASRVSEIPFAGWREIAFRTIQQIHADQVPIVAAGVAFFFLMALVPALTSLVTILSMIADPAALNAALSEFQGLIPSEMSLLLRGQLDAVAQAERQTFQLSLKTIVGFLLTLWFSSAGVRAMMAAVTIAYREDERRNPVAFHLVALAITVAGLFVAAILCTAFVALPIALSLLSLPSETEAIVRLARWPVLLVVIAIALGAIYRFGPARRQAKARWLTPGSIIATIVWLAGSALFTWYVEEIADYTAAHGALAAAIVLLLWLWFSAFVALAGAELNAEIEHQTAQDTTIGPDRPLGERGAFVADHVASRDSA